MIIDFNDIAVFNKLENDAIDGTLIYDDFPSEEYKYFSKLSKLGYMNRHKGWSKEICEAKQEEYKKLYYSEKENNCRFAELSRRIQKNILTSSELVRKIYFSKDKDEILLLALQVIEKLTNESGFSERIIKNMKED